MLNQYQDNAEPTWVVTIMMFSWALVQWHQWKVGRVYSAPQATKAQQWERERALFLQGRKQTPQSILLGSCLSSALQEELLQHLLCSHSPVKSPNHRGQSAWSKSLWCAQPVWLCG